MRYLITFKSLTYAQRAAQLLERAGISAAVARTPHTISREGCGYCVKVSERKRSLAVQTLNNAGYSYSRVFIETGDGTYREVI